MKYITEELTNELTKETHSPFIVEITLYRKWNGVIRSRTKTVAPIRNLITVYGDATILFSVGDICLVSCFPGMIEVAIDVIGYSTLSGLTTIYFTTGDINNFGSISPAYLYKKYTVPLENILFDSLGEISYRLDLPNMNEYDSGTFDFSLFNKDDIYWSELDKSGIMYNGCIETTILSTGGSTIGLNRESGDTIALNALKGQTLEILDGVAKGNTYDIRSNTTGWALSVFETTPITDGVEVGNKIRVNIINEYIVKVLMGLREFTGTQNRITVFGGTVESESIIFNPITETIEILVDGFLKELETVGAANICARITANEGLYLGSIPGVYPTNWEQHNSDVIRYGKRDIKFIRKEGNITGFKPQSVSGDFPRGFVAVFFRPPFWWKLEKGAWVTKCANSLEEIDTYLEVLDADKMYGDFTRDEFPTSATMGYFFVKEHADKDTISSQAQYLGIDNSIEYPIIIEPIRIVQDDSFVEGTYIAADITLVDAKIAAPLYIPYTFVLCDRIGAETVAFYIGFATPVESIIFDNLISSTGLTQTITWHYSKYGVDGAGWGVLSVIDNTSGLSESGNINFTPPDDWIKKYGAGALNLGYSMCFWVRGTFTVGATTKIEVDGIFNTINCITPYGDKFSFEINPDNLLLGDEADLEDSIIVARGESNNSIPITQLGSLYRGSRLYDLLVRAIAQTTLFQDATINESDFEIAIGAFEFRVLGQLPPNVKANSERRIILSFINDTLYIGINNEIWQFSYTTDIKRLGKLPELYDICNIMKSPDNSQVLGIVAQNTNQREAANIKSMTLWDLTGGTKDLSFSSVAELVDSRLFEQPGLKITVANARVFNIGRRNIAGYWNSQENPMSPIDTTLRYNRLLDELGVATFDAAILAYYLIRTDYDIYDVVDPFRIPARSYFSASVGLEVGIVPVDNNVEITYSMGTKGLWLGSNVAGSNYGLIVKDRETDSPYGICIARYLLGSNNALTLDRRILTFEGNLSTTPPVGSDTHEFNVTHGLNGSEANELLISGQMDRHTTWGTPFVAEDFGQIWKLHETEAGSINQYNEGIKPYKIWHFNGVATYTDVTALATVNLRGGESLYIVGSWRYTNLHINVHAMVGTPVFDYFLSNGTPGWDNITPVTDTLLEGAGSRELDFAMGTHWEAQIDANISPVNPNFLIRIDNTAGGGDIIQFNATNIRAHAWEIWGSENISTTEHRYLTPMEMIEDTTNKILYVSLWRREVVGAVWKMGAFDIGSIRGTTMTATITNWLKLTSSYPAGWDDSMNVGNLTIFTIDGTTWCYFTLTDPIQKEKTAKLLRFKLTPPSTITMEFVTNLHEGSWGCSELATDQTNERIYGMCYNDDETYLWEYCNKYYDRIESADFGDQSVREAMNNMCSANMLCLQAESDRKLKITKKFPDTISPIVIWTPNDYIISLESSEIYNEYFDQINIKYQDGEIVIGSGDFSSRRYEFDAKNTISREVAKSIGERLLRDLKARRRMIKLKITPLFFHELKDFVRPRIPIRLGAIDQHKKFMLVELTINPRTGEGDTTLLEVY